jgi:adenylosuccinate synthase
MPCTVVVGAQWGDEGKGKIVDLLALEHDVVARFQGGANAGHSVVHEGRTVVLHLVPSGILHPDKRCVIGNGVVVDPAALRDELQELDALGVRALGRLTVSLDAHVILPYHRLAEREREAGPNAVGTTQRGIGPAYEDRAARSGVRVRDLLDAKALERGVESVRRRAAGRLENAGGFPEPGAVIRQYRTLGDELAGYFGDARGVVWDALDRGEKVLLEGAQGTLLDIDHGTYPFVTSSSTVAGGALTGAGIGPRDVQRVVGVAKAYTTRVGNGPFVTEFDETMGARVREMGEEFGATTGRPRRCGWLDAVALRYAARVNGLDEIILTKLDVLDDLEEVQIAVRYRTPDGETDRFPTDAAALATTEGIYETLPGWRRPTRGTHRFEDLPDAARAYVRRLETLVGTRVSRVSLGPERDATLSVPPAVSGAPA